MCVSLTLKVPNPYIVYVYCMIVFNLITIMASHQHQANTNGPFHTKRKRPEMLNPNDRRTLFILGLPADVTHRELQNMLYFWPGKFYPSHPHRIHNARAEETHKFHSTTGGCAVCRHTAVPLWRCLSRSDVHCMWATYSVLF